VASSSRSTARWRRSPDLRQHRLATWLHAAGYHTTHIGKYLNGYGLDASATCVPPGWDNWRAAIGTKTQLLYDYPLNENGVLVNYGSAPADFKADVFAALAVANIQARADAGSFFMGVNVTAPHNERPTDDQSARAAPRHEGMFAVEPFPVKGNFNEGTIRDKPAWVRALPRLTTAVQAEVAQSWRDKLEGLQSVDDLVERVIEALSAEGVLNNTVIIFTSDNGFFFGEHRIPIGKEHVYEEATHVPLIIRGNVFTGGTVRTQVVANIDLAPTIAQLAGVAPGLVQDGISLVPYGSSPTFLLENDPDAAYAFNAIRTKRWVYSRLATGEDELYNIINDPLQLTSRHAASGQAARKAVLASHLDQLEECAGATCRLSYSN
jgi:arylsulfatase A-like enzyme